MKNCAIVGWEEGLAGQVSQWINYNIKFYIIKFYNLTYNYKF